MFNTKFLISTVIFVFFLIITSIVKNKTRIIEKNISELNIKILDKNKNINESQLDFYYLTSPSEIEKRLNNLGIENYQPISFSKIFLKISDFTKIQHKISNLQESNEKKIQNK